LRRASEEWKEARQSLQPGIESAPQVEAIMSSRKRSKRKAVPIRKRTRSGFRGSEGRSLFAWLTIAEFEDRLERSEDEESDKEEEHIPSGSWQLRIRREQIRK